MMISLQDAVEHGQLDVVRSLLSNGAHIDMEYPSECSHSTLLMIASKNGHSETASLLLSHIANMAILHSFVCGESSFGCRFAIVIKWS